MASEGWDVATVGELASVYRGATWGKAQEFENPTADSEPVVGISVTSSDGSLDLTKLKHVANLDSKVARLAQDDLLMVMSNGNPGRIGNIYRVDDRVTGMPFSAFQLAIRVHSNVILPRFLHCYLSEETRQKEMTDLTAGSTGLRNLNLSKIRSFPVGVPPLGEQRRIVDLITAFDDSIEAAGKAVEQSLTLYRELMASSASDISTYRPLEEALTRVTSASPVLSHLGYRIVGLERSGQGFIDRGVVSGSEIGYSKLTPVGSDQLVYRKLTAWEGPISVTDERVEGSWVSAEFPVFDIDREVLIPGLLRHICRWPSFWEKMAGLLTGSVLRRKRLNPEQLLRLEIPMPAITVQESVLGLLDAAWSTYESAKSVVECQRNLRSEILTSLLSGAHRIPETYDELMGA